MPEINIPTAETSAASAPSVPSVPITPAIYPLFSNQPIAYGIAYVPFQTWGKTYEPEVAFNRGTLFPDLDKPFIGEEAVPRG